MIGEILSRGVERLLCAQEEEARETAQGQRNAKENLSQEASELLAAVVKFGEITTGEAIEHAGISRSTARRRLAELVAAGKLCLRGNGRGARYTLPDEMPTTQK